MIFDTWWIWMVAGVVLAVFEVVIPGFIFLGFAIGAVLTGVLLALGILAGALEISFLVFAILSVAAFLILRKAVGVRRGQTKVWTQDINDNN